jgi:nucleotide-binding universal stress UspA family protein
VASPIQQLLVPIDFSGDSERAIMPALRLAYRAEVPVVLFSWSFDEGEAAAAKRYLTDVAADLAGPVTVEVAVTEDRTAAPAIAAAAARHAATVCMAAHGRSGIGHAVLGSVAEETLGLLRRPTVLVGPWTDVAPPLQRSSVIACTDGSSLSETVLPVACAWARQLHLPLQLVQVIEHDEVYETAMQPPDLLESAYLAGLAATLDCGGRPDYEVLHGDVAEAIASYANAQAELIAVATHGRGGISRTVLGSIAMRVVHRARRPVLVVPPAQRR